MPKCPQCTKPLREITRRCPSCQADLDLLVDYVSHLQGGLERAENLVKAGELGQAIWAYLEVLEVDPDNPVARKQISQVVTAIRQFDTIMPGRRFAHGLPPELPKAPRPWWHWAIFAGVIVAALGVGFGASQVDWEAVFTPLPQVDPSQKPINDLMGPKRPPD
jgi:predicted membrane protein